MISFKHQLAPFHSPDAKKVRQSVFKSHGPASVSRYQQQIIVAPDSFPRLEYFPIMIAPALAETVHSLARPAFQVHISDCEYSHRQLSR